MKKVCLFLVGVLICGCAANPALYRKIPPPFKGIVKAGPVSNILTFPESSRKLNGKFPSHQPTSIKMAVGESVELHAFAEDENSRRFKIEPTWKCGKEGSLSSKEGEKVTFTLNSKIDGTLFIDAKSGDEEGGIIIENK